MTIKRRKITVVGDKSVGKTSLLMAFISGKFVEDQQPIDHRMNQIGTLEIDNQLVELSLWDSQSDNNFDLLRSLAYAYTDVFLICFSIDQPETLENVYSKWIVEVRKVCPKAKIVLVGTKKDLRPPESENEKFVQWDTGNAMREKIKAFAYVECSSKTREGIADVFGVASKASAVPKNNSTCLPIFQKLFKPAGYA